MRVVHDVKRQGAADLLGLLHQHGMRAGLSVGICGLMLWLLLGRLSAIEPAAVALAFGQLAPQAWALAAVATGISFWAVGHYDAVIHRHFATKLPQARARAAGICAIAVSQMIGLGVISGAVLRWRMLPEIGPWAAARLTAAVAMSFLAAWAMVTAATLVILPDAPFKMAAAGVLSVGTALALMSIAAPRIGRLRWPNMMTLGQLGALCVVDTMAAALAFYALCPPGVDLTLTLLLPAFLLALGAGLVSGAPGGMGAFEMTLLALLPSHPEAGLLAAVLGWRIVYFAVPAILGAGFAIRGPRGIGTALPSRNAPPIGPLLAKAPEAEVQILRQGQHRVIGLDGGARWVAGQTSHCLVGLFGPLNPMPGALDLTSLTNTAKAEGRNPVLYKVRPRLAAQARAQGWAVLAMAREAVVSLPGYHLDTPDRATLRRKLRRAGAAGVCILGPFPTPDVALTNGPTIGPKLAPDWPSLDQIAEVWAQVHGGARGFSMGRYARDYVQGQKLFVACVNVRPIAFVTFHAGPRHWVLDLMRHLPDIPDGTMHLLVHTAMVAAKAAHVPELSLAAVPETAFADRRGWLATMLARTSASPGSAGLLRFKSSFAPRWERRYLCLPSHVALPLVTLDLARAIRRPPPLPDPAATSAALHAPPSDTFPSEARPTTASDTEYAFASAGCAWQDG